MMALESLCDQPSAKPHLIAAFDPALMRIPCCNLESSVCSETRVLTACMWRLLMPAQLLLMTAGVYC